MKYEVTFNFKGKKKRYVASAGGRNYKFKTKRDAMNYAKDMKMRYNDRMNVRVRKCKEMNY